MTPELGQLDVELVVEPNPVAPTELQEVGVRYWLVDGVDESTNALVWKYKTKDLDFEQWSGTAHYAAAAAVTATAPGLACRSCGGDLTLGSRQTFADARLGRRAVCRACSRTIDERAAKILDPANLADRARRAETAAAKRHEREEAQRAEQARRASQQTLDQDRRDAIATRYAVEPDDGGYALAHATLAARLGALAVIHAVGDNGGLIYPVNYADHSITPDDAFGRELFVAAWHEGLLRIHPTSPSNAFVWEDDVWGGETATLGDGIYAHLVRFYVPGEGNLPDRLEAFTDDLRESLSLGPMWSTEREKLAGIAERIIAEEAARYLVQQLRDHNLPDLNEKHEEALRTHAKRGAELFSIGHLYRMAWSTARSASSAYQRNTGMSKANAVTYGLKEFDRWIQRASDDPNLLSEPFNEDKKSLPLSAVTSLVFRTILGLDPMSADMTDVMTALAGSPDAELRRQCDEGIPERHELIEWVRTTSTQWSGEDFRRVIARLDDWEPELCAPNCAHDRVAQVAREAGRVYDRIVARVGDSDAAILTAEATGVANAIRDGARTGDAVLAEIVDQLRMLMSSDVAE